MTRIPRLALLALLLGAPAVAGEEKPPSVFDQPRIRAAQGREVAGLMAAGDYGPAAEQLQELLRNSPGDYTVAYNLACALARLGKRDEALDRLKEAVQRGFRDRRHIEADDDLQSLRDGSRFQEILKAAEVPLRPREQQWRFTVKPAQPADGQVVVDEANVAWNPLLGTFHAAFALDEAGKDQPVAVGLGEAGELLRKWYEEGTAAGNRGDLYDNHDSDHSNMNLRALPQLTRIEFSDAAKQRGLHHGLQRWFLYNGVTIGNSSTAITSGPFWRCQGRLALTQPGGAGRLYLQYRGNHLYFYPEHRDHDPGHNGADKQGHGDVFPANTPYLILSQGSSGSDRAFLSAVAATLAAFRPEVKSALTKAGLLMPTVQMIFRRSNKQVENDDDYLTGKAHPTVFDDKQLDVPAMVKLAHGITADSLPPLVQIKVVQEDEAVVGRDYFDTAPRERLFDTPCAIARLIKSTRYLRTMVVSAEESEDPHGKPLAYHWAVLRGDAERIRIEPLNEQGSIVELQVPYHERRPVREGAALDSNRVDIGAFVHNGDYYSAPAFVSFFYLDNERRTYDDRHRIRVVDYTDESTRNNYVDPLLDLQKDWRDEYRYDDGGRLKGWTRIRGDERQQFTPEGRLVVATNDAGEPAETRAVRYLARRRERRAAVLEQVEVDEAADQPGAGGPDPETGRQVAPRG